ncbi:SMI1/KNR4 family protein [Microbacterium sp. MPKO10]|uniref:SMI1/KNR4 family protein n=1 Tax=Microbacterium sp. MPKO10 TaxID=2989818 RepID=UPI0022364971|nr:SMI1/KNR4 family protein [Microbacterium sp. MPKO10]MCW4457831.1 SMI1/KNR4 family protein [Microbacterium sp. MPKO10]
MHTVKNDIAQWDPQGIFPNFFPEVAASEQAIAQTESALGVVLDSEHRSFLSFADGWRCFHHSVNLMGTAALVSGPDRDAALEAFTYAPEVLEEDLRIPAERLLPIAATPVEADVFVMPITNGRVDPIVHWLAEGELIDTYTSFGEYFASMILYARKLLTDMKSGRYNR